MPTRRELLRHSASISLLPLWSACAATHSEHIAKPARRVRPGDPDWTSAAHWERLNVDVGGRLIPVHSPFDACRTANAQACAAVFERLRNPYYIGDHPALTQTSGWADAWISSPSVYAVAATSTADAVAAVNFAREHNLRLVVKGGGHSYQGTSNAPDSLLICTRAMNTIELHQDFVAAHCERAHSPQHAVSIGAGAMWIQAYDAVTSKGGRYVQGGGCATVGVAGLIQSGGFGSFSKGYGLAAAGLLEAEVMTADGVVRIANACTHPDLFWALKGGGGGSFGVVTRVTLRTRELPERFGAVSATIRAKTDRAFVELIGETMRFYREQLLNPHWGEQCTFTSNNELRISMLFQGLDQRRAEGVWRPFLDRWRGGRSARRPSGQCVLERRSRAGRPVPSRLSFRMAAGRVARGWATRRPGQRAVRMHEALGRVTALQQRSGRRRGVRSRDGARYGDQPCSARAFALAIIAGEGAPAMPGVNGFEPDLSVARRARTDIDAAMTELLRVAPGAGSYVAEGDYFEPQWQHAHWGANYPRLAAVKQKHDPDGLFFVHHGVGSERWSEDGFTRLDG